MSTPHSCIRCLSPLPYLAVVPNCPVCGSKVELIDTPVGSPANLETPPTVWHAPSDRPGAAPATWTSPPATAATALLDEDHHPSVRFPALAGYEVQKVIGVGGMGVVYQAMQRRAGRTVALKVVQGLAGADWRQRVRFDNEVQALGRLVHPNIITVYEVGEEDGTPFFSMEYITDGTLADRLRSNPRMPAAEAAELIAAAAKGVAAAHRVGVLHRDLKPSNILVAADGVVKVGDFGLAKLLDRDDGPTHTGMVVGTPSYMAPEQAGGKVADVGPATDVYGLGATLYHLLTGRPPFKEGSPIGTALRVVNESPPTPRAICPDVDPVLEAIVLKAMAKNPAERYPSACTLAADLLAWRCGEPTSVRPPTHWQKARRWIKRHRAKLAAAVLLPLIAVAAAVAKRESDPVRSMERQLDRGEPYIGVGATGRPAYSRWVVGEVPSGESAVGDGSFGFQTHALSLLELVPDPRSERYHVSIELRHISGSGYQPLVGIYLGYAETVGPDGGRVQRWVGLEFSEFWDASQIVQPELKDHHALKGEDYLMFPVRGERGYSHRSLGTRSFRPAQDNNSWRHVEVEVSPEGITAYWGEDRILGQALTVTKGQLAMSAAGHYETSIAPTGGDLALVPGWAPRRPLGVFARSSAIALRNLIVQPQP